MFTQPAFIRKNTLELWKKLERLGYIYDKTNLVDLSLYPCLYTYWHPNLEGLYSGIGAYVNNTINCGTNEELFLAIAALRDDSDDMQWFTNVTNNIWCRFGDKHISKTIDSMCINLHKATVEELIEHFK